MRSTMAILILAGLLCYTAPVQAEIFGDYLGHTACIDCHPDISKGWLTTPHAHAFATLKEQGVEKQTNPGCVGCHVVAFGEDGGYIDMDLTPELKDVQCENCHGPGRKHVESDGDSDLIVSKPDENLCRTCHTPGQDKNFNYTKKSKHVHGRSTAEGVEK